MASAEIVAEEDLDALFDSLSDARQKEIKAQHTGTPAPDAAAGAPVDAPDAVATADSMYNKIGALTRQLHEALQELGFDKALQSAAHDIPDARDRLGYIAKLTGQAAERALAAVEVGQQEQSQLREQASQLSKRWEQFFANTLGIEEFRSLAQDTRIFMVQAQSRSEATEHQLTEIMMAQDFHDLTGQVIQKLTTLAKRMEEELLKFLIEALPDHRRQELKGDDLEGPIVNAKGRSDVVTDQSQVDDLLESLGF